MNKSGCSGTGTGCLWFFLVIMIIAVGVASGGIALIPIGLIVLLIGIIVKCVHVSGKKTILKELVSITASYNDLFSQNTACQTRVNLLRQQVEDSQGKLLAKKEELSSLAQEESALGQFSTGLSKLINNMGGSKT